LKLKKRGFLRFFKIINFRLRGKQGKREPILNFLGLKEAYLRLLHGAYQAYKVGLKTVMGPKPDKNLCLKN